MADKILSALAELDALFRRRGYNGSSTWHDRMSALAQSDPAKFEEAILGVNMWGGSGSLFDFLFYSQDGMREEDYRDNLLKNQLMLDIMTGLRDRGHEPPFYGKTEATLKQLMSYYENYLQK